MDRHRLPAGVRIAAFARRAISDLFGRKWTFIGGLAGFALASAVGGAAPSFGVLVAVRATQGGFGAVLAPAALSLLTTTFTKGPERGKVFGALAGGGGAVGLLLGGVLTEYLSWRWCLYVNLFFAAVAIAGAAVLLRNQGQPEKPRLDLPGTVTGSAGLVRARVRVLQRRPDELDRRGDAGRARPSGRAPDGVRAARAARGPPAAAASDRAPPRPWRLLPRGDALSDRDLRRVSVHHLLLQQNLRFSPLQAGFAFLPMVAMIMTSSITANVKQGFRRSGARKILKSPGNTGDY